MAYITRHNLERLGVEDPKKLPIGIYRSDREPILYGDSSIDNWFSDLEINQILILKALIEEDYNRYGGVLKLIYIMTPEDSYTKVYKPTPPAYHKNIDCPFMHSDYRNFEFPANFKEIYGIEAVEDFRKWFKKEGEGLLSEDSQKFYNHVTLYWPGKKKDGQYYQINWQSFIDSEENNSNSGVDSLSNPKIRDIIEGINKLKEEFNYFQNRLLSKQKEYFFRYIQRTYIINEKKYSIRDSDISENDKKELINNLNKFLKKFKNPMRSYLLIYYSLQAGNIDLQLKDTVLDALGFRPCSHCYPK